MLNFSLDLRLIIFIRLVLLSSSFSLTTVISLIPGLIQPKGSPGVGNPGYGRVVGMGIYFWLGKLIYTQKITDMRISQGYGACFTAGKTPVYPENPGYMGLFPVMG